MFINNQIKPEEYKEDFLNNGSVIIRDFLNDEHINKLYNFLNSNMPDDWWYSSSCPGTEGQVRYIRNTTSNIEVINNEREFSEKVFNEGGYSYHFYRSIGDHYETCMCEECWFRDWLKSDEVISFLNKVSGFEITNFSTMFASKYTSGCFLGPHHDDTLGKIGFVLQLTKDWRPQWGGILHFLNDSLNKIEYSESPTFNTLTLFHIPEGMGKWHYVSHVGPGVSKSRIAYSGWYY